MTKENNVRIVRDEDGRELVVIDEIIFRGRRSISWGKVKEYLKQYIGEIIEVAETNEMINIEKDFPDEFKGSNYTSRLHGGMIKTKANISQAIREVVYIARKTREMKNKKKKNSKKAENGWHRYITRFAIPIFLDGIISHYNVYQATVVVRKDADNKLCLYDIINIKKEASNPLKL